MGKVSYVLEFTIEEGNVDAFTSKAKAYIAAVRDNEPETFNYQWYLGEDGKHCLLYESFASSEALLTHLGNVAPTLPGLLAVAPITRVDVLGTASPAARESLAGLGAKHFPSLGVFER